MATHQRQLQIDPWQDLTDAGRFQEPVEAHLLDLVWNQGPIKIAFISVIVDDDFATGVLLRQLLHPPIDEHAKVVQDIGQQDELLWVERGRCHIIQQLCALNGNSKTSNFILFLPELPEFSI